MPSVFSSRLTEDGLEPTAYGLWFHCSTNWTIPSFSWLWPRLPEFLVHMVKKGFTVRSWKGSGVSLFCKNQEVVFYCKSACFFLFFFILFSRNKNIKIFFSNLFFSSGIFTRNSTRECKNEEKFNKFSSFQICFFPQWDRKNSRKKRD